MWCLVTMVTTEDQRAHRMCMGAGEMKKTQIDYVAKPIVTLEKKKSFIRSFRSPSFSHLIFLMFIMEDRWDMGKDRSHLM